MRKISRRDFLKIAGVSAAAAGLTACGGSTSSTATATSTAGSTASSGPEKITLKVWGPAEDQADDTCWMPVVTKAFA
jgi:ABC-type glycerol-3-phosphate transport system substrate-binding protein